MKARDIPAETLKLIDIIADEPEQKPFDNDGFDRDVKQLASSEDRVTALAGLLGKYEQNGAGRFLLERDDKGKLKREAELRVIADVLSGKGGEDSLGSYFYGDDWSRVKADAESSRREMNAGLHVGTGVWNTSPGMFTASDGAVKEAMRYDLGSHRLTPANTLTHKPPSGAEDPTRSHFVPATGSTFTPRDRLAEIIHEVTGHGFNNVRVIGNGQPKDPLTQDNTKDMYYVANDAELMAELGNLRKFVYRSSRLNGKAVDIANGNTLTLVLDSLGKNKEAYGSLPYNTEQFVEQMNKLRTYAGDDEFLRSRRDEVFGKLTGSEAGKYLKQVAQAPKDKIRESEDRAASKGGNAPGKSKSSGVPSGHNAALDGYSGPRIVINPSTFRNEKDGLCVAFDEAFRVLMEVNGFDPVSEPTEKQRQFFSDTAYADDERMLRRTILARICTFDTSVTDPTDEQLQEAVEFLDTVMEIGAPQNEWEQRSVQRIRDTVAKAIGQPRTEEKATAEPPAEGPSNAAAGGGETEEDKRNAAKEFVAANGGGELADGTKVSSEEDRAAAKEFVAANGGGELADGTKVAAAGTQVLDQRAPGGKTASERIGTSSGVVGMGGRELTAGEAAWQARRQASTQAWMQRTGRNEDVLNNTASAPDQIAPAQTVEVAWGRDRDKGLFQDRQTDSGRRDRLGRRLDDRGRVIA